MYPILAILYEIIDVYLLFCSLELRELQAKLRAGYMNRERAAQFAEKTARELEVKVHLIILTLSSGGGLTVGNVALYNPVILHT